MPEINKYLSFYDEIPNICVVGNKTDESKYTLGIIAGVHGDEPGSIILAKRLMNYFENECGDNFPAKFSEIKILPFANVPAIINNTRDYKEMCNPRDTNLNRGWGMDDDEYNMDGIRNIIKEFVDDADVIIDLHSSPTCIPGFLIDSNQTYSDALIKWCEDSNINCMVRDCTNPTIKKYYLNKFADSADADAVNLKAAALPGQKYKVMIPINTLSDKEVYAPSSNKDETFGELISASEKEALGTVDIESKYLLASYNVLVIIKIFLLVF